jgi:hypothetical protein
MTRTSWLSAISCATFLAAIAVAGCGSSSPGNKDGGGTGGRNNGDAAGSTGGASGGGTGGSNGGGTGGMTGADGGTQCMQGRTCTAGFTCNRTCPGGTGLQVPCACGGNNTVQCTSCNANDAGVNLDALSQIDVNLPTCTASPPTGACTTGSFCQYQGGGQTRFCFCANTWMCN